MEYRNAMRYALPAIGVAVPIAMLLNRMRCCERGENKDVMLLSESSIDLQTAMHKALKLVPGTPVEVELEEECGIPVWQVDIVPKKGGPTREVVIDARTGDLLEMRAEMEES
ncbi:MAG: PepSY domain-containing protein [Armatimonadota bacterium]